MIDRARQRISRPELKNRRAEIEQRLALCGLSRGPRRLLDNQSAADPEAPRSRRLRVALEGLGPIFSAFGLYLSSRVDLWQVTDCLELASIPDRAEATPADELRRVLIDGIDCLPEQPFSSFETEPFESRLLFQSHYARLNSGMDVVVKVIHPEAESQLLYDIDLLTLFKDAGGCVELSESTFKSVVADFAHTIDQQMDFVYEAQAFETLALDAEDYDVLRAPHVYKRLCTSKVLVIEKLDGLRLDDVLSLSDSSGEADSASVIQAVGFERSELARLLCEVWLRQALLGRSFPIEPHSGNILVLPSKQISFSGGAFASLPSEPKVNLWDYLMASTDENSDKACSCLLKEMTREARSSKDDELRQRFRQAMPFRDGGWSASGDSQTVAELLFVHWRFARECGYLPLMHLPGFFRGLFSIANSARRLAPQVDSVAEGLRDLRLLTGLTRFSKMMSRRHLADQLDRYAATIVDMPQSLDEALTFASEGLARVRLHSTDSADHHRSRSSSAVVAAWTLFLAAIVLLSHYIGTAVVSRVWIERISAIVFVTLSLLLLRTGLSRV